MRRNKQLPLIAVVTLALALILIAQGWPQATHPDPLRLLRSEHAPIPRLDQPDVACRRCHEAIYDSYQRTPMARGSGVAVDNPAAIPASSESGFVHVPSGITYAIVVQEGHPILMFDRPAGRDHAALSGQRDLLYFIGSGTRGRTYLYQQDHLWFEAPINWYGKKKIWDMAPAYEHSPVLPAPLPVDANCLHCHAGEVQTATGGARNHFPAAPFRASGVGCAACHGDPAAHLVSAGLAHLGQPSILNPARLDPVRRDSVCLQCHLEGDATVYLPGRSLAAFQPGHDLFRSALYFVDNNRVAQGGRATSQYEALLRSACKRASGDKLTCTTCHDPHSSPAPAERVAYFRAKCLTCHTGQAMAVSHHPEQQDCAVCHMPTRKTLDISHEQLTDHDIEVAPIEPRAAAHPGEIADLVPVGPVKTGDRELGLAYAQLAQRGSRAAGVRALALLEHAESTGSDDNELHDQLGFLLQISGNLPEAQREYQLALRERPQDPTAAANLAVLDAEQNKPAEALELLRQTFAEDPSQTAAALNLAFLDCRTGKKDEALAVLRKALRFNPDSLQGRSFLSTGRYNGQTCLLDSPAQPKISSLHSLGR